MYNNAELEKKDRRKVIIIATATVVLILALIVAIIVVATNKTSRPNVGGEDNSSFVIENTSKPEKTEVVSNTKAAEPAKTTTPVTTKAEEMPSTGPEDILPLALVLGMIATVATSAVITRKA